MKKKVGELYHKPIVVGDKNKVENYEIHIDDLVKTTEESEGKYRYFMFDKDNILDDDIITMLKVSKYVKMSLPDSGTVIYYTTFIGCEDVSPYLEYIYGVCIKCDDVYAQQGENIKLVEDVLTSALEDVDREYVIEVEKEEFYIF